MGTSDPWASVEVVRGDRPGRWDACIDDLWVAWTVPLGGLSAAVAAAAMEAELAACHPATEGQRLRTLHCLFAAPVPAGPVAADVEVLRAGRTQSQVRTTVHGPGEAAGLTALAAFGRSRPGYAFVESRPPEVPPPEECPRFGDPPPPDVDWPEQPRSPLWTSLLDGRAAIGLPPWDPTPRTDAEAASWYRFLTPPPVAADGTVGTSPVVALSDLMLGSIGQRIGDLPTPWFGPSVDLTVHLLAPAPPGWILSHNRAHVAADGYASIETTMWGEGASGALEVVAFATQQMYFLFPEGPPPADGRDLDRD